jgi:hypothetical protein
MKNAKTIINRIHAQAVTEWTVETAPGITVTFPGGQMTPLNINRTDYYSDGFSAVNTNEILSNAPKPVVVEAIRQSAVNNSLRQGEANDGAEITRNAYSMLYLNSIQTEGDGTIQDARLFSKLNRSDIDHLEASLKDGRSTQKTDVLFKRIARVSPANAETLRKMIDRKDSRQSFLDSLVYELTDEDRDHLSDWITFHNDNSITITINLEGLGNTDSQTPTPQSDFTRIMAHELLHHWWTHFQPFLKLKWKVIADESEKGAFILSDGLGNNSSSNCRGCSSGPGHERNNPENKTVCEEQYNYN